MNSRASLEEDQDGDTTTNEAPSFRGRSPARAPHVHCSSTANDHRTAGAGFRGNRSRKTRLATNPVGLFRTGNHEQQRYLRVDGGRGHRRSWFFFSRSQRVRQRRLHLLIGLSNAVISGHSSQSTKTRRAAISRCNRRLKSLAFPHPIRNSPGRSRLVIVRCEWNCYDVVQDLTSSVCHPFVLARVVRSTARPRSCRHLVHVSRVRRHSRTIDRNKGCHRVGRARGSRSGKPGRPNWLLEPIRPWRRSARTVTTTSLGR